MQQMRNCTWVCAVVVWHCWGLSDNALHCPVGTDCCLCRRFVYVFLCYSMQIIIFHVFRSTLRQRRPIKAGLKCSSVNPSVHTSERPQSFSSISLEVDEWCTTVCIMTRCKVKVKVTSLSVGNPAIFKSCLLRHLQWELTTNHGFVNYRAQYLNMIGPDFWYLS